MGNEYRIGGEFYLRPVVPALASVPLPLLLPHIPAILTAAQQKLPSEYGSNLGGKVKDCFLKMASVELLVLRHQELLRFVEKTGAGDIVDGSDNGGGSSFAETMLLVFLGAFECQLMLRHCYNSPGMAILSRCLRALCKAPQQLFEQYASKIIELACEPEGRLLPTSGLSSLT